MNLLDRYVTEIGKHLPQKNRNDIEAEIRSTLQDMLEDRSQQTGKPIDDAMTIELLKEYGSPKQVASTYHSTHYLIGPRMFPMFELVLKIVIAAVMLGMFVSFIVSLITHGITGQQFINSLGQLALNLFSGIISAFGNVVLVFAILERTIPNADLEKEFTEGDKWDPAELTKEPEPDQIKFGELIFEIIITVIGLIIINLYPNLIGIGFMTNGNWVFIPTLSEAFFRFVPYINITALLGIGLNVYLLRQGNWTLVSRIFKILLDVAGIVILIALMQGPSLIALSAEQLAGTPLNVENAERLLQLANSGLHLALLVAIIVTTVVTCITVFRLFRKNVGVSIPLVK